MTLTVEGVPVLRFGRFELQPGASAACSRTAGRSRSARARSTCCSRWSSGATGWSPRTSCSTLVWPGLVVEENNLQVQVSDAAQAARAAARSRPSPGAAIGSTLPRRAGRRARPRRGARRALPADPARRAPARARPTCRPRPAAAVRPRRRPGGARARCSRSTALVTVVGAGGIGKTPRRAGGRRSVAASAPASRRRLVGRAGRADRRRAGRRRRWRARSACKLGRDRPPARGARVARSRRSDCCSCSTTASTCSTPSRQLVEALLRRRAAACACSSPARSR